MRVSKYALVCFGRGGALCVCEAICPLSCEWFAPYTGLCGVQSQVQQLQRLQESTMVYGGDLGCVFGEGRGEEDQLHIDCFSCIFVVQCVCCSECSMQGKGLQHLLGFLIGFAVLAPQPAGVRVWTNVPSVIISEGCGCHHQGGPPAAWWSASHCRSGVLYGWMDGLLAACV